MLQGEDIVFGGQRLAVAPHEAVAQLEGPGQPVLGLLPAFRRQRASAAYSLSKLVSGTCSSSEPEARAYTVFM